MQLSDKGIAFIKGFEGCHKVLPDGRIEAYWDALGKVWTLGYGCTAGIREGTIVTRAEAEEMFRRELAQFEVGVSNLVKVALSQGQFDALVSFSYNCGVGALEKSTLLAELNKGRYDSVPSQIMRYTHAGGKYVQGLQNRRFGEVAMWRSIPAQIAAPAEPLPQNVHECPAETPVATAKRSWTISGAGIAASGAVANGWAQVTGIAAETKAQTDALQAASQPMADLWTLISGHAGMISLGFVVIGIGIVVFRKFSDARQGKLS